MNRMSLVVPAYRRHHNLPEICRSVKETVRISEVIIWNNGEPISDNTQDDLQALAGRPVRVFNSPNNVKTFGRYLAAQQAQNDLIATQDDDCVVRNFDNLYGLCTSYESSLGRVCANLRVGHWRWGIRDKNYLHEKCGLELHEILVGWGAVFPKRRTEVVMHYANWLKSQRRAELLYSSADRAFGMLQQEPHVPLPHGDTWVQHFDDAEGGMAIYKQPGHWKRVKEAHLAVFDYLTREGTHADRV